MANLVKSLDRESFLLFVVDAVRDVYFDQPSGTKIDLMKLKLRLAESGSSGLVSASIPEILDALVKISLQVFTNKYILVGGDEKGFYLEFYHGVCSNKISNEQGLIHKMGTGLLAIVKQRKVSIPSTPSTVSVEEFSQQWPGEKLWLALTRYLTEVDFLVRLIPGDDFCHFRLVIKGSSADLETPLFAVHENDGSVVTKEEFAGIIFIIWKDKVFTGPVNTVRRLRIRVLISWMKEKQYQYLFEDIVDWEQADVVQSLPLAIARFGGFDSCHISSTNYDLDEFSIEIW